MQRRIDQIFQATQSLTQFLDMNQSMTCTTNCVKPSRSRPKYWQDANVDAKKLTEQPTPHRRRCNANAIQRRVIIATWLPASGGAGSRVSS